ncbi:MAG: hypothetical protein GEV08_15870, partial [Acidimicrobiia bacterium]|nr:hypothetical protein [Acidimicrobiia bacterium]
MAVAAAVVAGWPALTQGVASGDGDGSMTTAAELTLSATARQLGAYRSAAAVIARKAAATDAPDEATPAVAASPATTAP